LYLSEETTNAVQRVRIQPRAHGSWRKSGGRGTTLCFGLALPSRRWYSDTCARLRGLVFRSCSPTLRARQAQRPGSLRYLIGCFPLDSVGPRRTQLLADASRPAKAGHAVTFCSARFAQKRRKGEGRRGTSPAPLLEQALPNLTHSY